MVKSIEQLMDQYERGGLSRRELISALLLLGVPAGAQAQAAKPIASGQSINHVHIDVLDLEKSIAFYGDLLGATVRDTSPGNATLSLPGKPTWMSLTQTKGEKGGYNHVGFGVPMKWNGVEAARIAKEINSKYPAAKANPTGDTVAGKSTRSIYLNDPSGIRFQLNPVEDDGWLPTGVVGSKLLNGEKG
jgi:catechol 2,3-dioxygenase-like lactoylglutathione lyase family enzyme